MPAGASGVDGHRAVLWYCKAWYSCFFGSRAFVAPYLNLYSKRLGYSPVQLGVLAVLRAWLTAPMTSAFSAWADAYTVHRSMMVAQQVLSVLASFSLVLFTHPFPVVVISILSFDVLGSANSFADTYTAAVTDGSPTEYGRCRLWGAVAWGAVSLFSGILTSQLGFGANVGCYAAIASAGVWVIVRGLDFQNVPGFDHCATAIRTDTATAQSVPPSEDAPETAQEHHRLVHDELQDKLGEELLQVSVKGSRGASKGCSCDGMELALMDQPTDEQAPSGPVTLESPMQAGAPGSARHQSPDTGQTWLHKFAVFRRPDVLVFLFQAMLMGYGMGTYETYLFVFLDELGASEELMGVSVTFTILTEIPIFHHASAIIEALGHPGTLAVILGAFVLRLLAYSSLAHWPSLWLVLLVELLHGITFALAWSLGTTFVHQRAPPGLRATMQGAFQGAYMGLGRGLGGLVGGLWYKHLGPPVCFLLQALVILLAGSASLVVYAFLPPT